MKGKAYIGTSNIVVPGNKSTFPEAYHDKSRLTYYASLFSSLEINSSFYKIPMPSTFAKWRSEVPDNFRFSVKVWKGITHEKELKYSLADVKKFITAVASLEEKAGCLLIQFPASIKRDKVLKVSKLLKLVHRLSSQSKLAIEFRDAEWYTDETSELITDIGGCIVMHDMPKSKLVTPIVDEGANFIRYHGSLGDYRGSYNKTYLSQQATMIKKLIRKGSDVYAYFNNTIGDAYNNARTLQSLITPSMK